MIKPKNLRRAFLKAPVKFSRIFMFYQKRRIAYYGRVNLIVEQIMQLLLEHPSWLQQMAVTKSSYTRGNGNYVKLNTTTPTRPSTYT